MIATDRLAGPLAETMEEVFGDPTDPMFLVESRARRLLASRQPIVWEGDAQTFQFMFVGGAAEEVLGYPVSRWTEEATFWTDFVVHPEDRDAAVSFCAMATGKCLDHDFEYRARRADGGIVLLHDIVRVVRGSRGVAERLRGVMIPIESRNA